MSFQLVSPSVPMVDKNGRVTQEWFLFLRGLFQASGNGNTQINQSELEALFYASDRITQDNSEEVFSLLNSSSQSRNENAEIDGLKRRIEALENLAQIPNSIEIDSIKKRIDSLEKLNQIPRNSGNKVEDSQLQAFIYGSRLWL